jgi:hypothetical protein
MITLCFIVLFISFVFQLFTYNIMLLYYIYKYLFMLLYYVICICLLCLFSLYFNGVSLIFVLIIL